MSKKQLPILYIVTCSIKWVTTSWTDGTIRTRSMSIIKNADSEGLIGSEPVLWIKHGSGFAKGLDARIETFLIEIVSDYVLRTNIFRWNSTKLSENIYIYIYYVYISSEKTGYLTYWLSFMGGFVWFSHLIPVCPIITYLFYIVTYHIKWVTTSWAHSLLTWLMVQR